MVKNPISRHVASISRATACLDASPPTRAAERSITGICCMFFSPKTSCSMVVGPTVNYQGLPRDESRIGPCERRQPPPRGPLPAYRVRGRARAAKALSLLLACSSAHRAYLIQKASTVKDERVHWKKRQKQIERLKARHGADRSLIREFPDLKVEQRTGPCSNVMRGSTARRPRPAGMKQFPVGHSHKQGLELITPGTDLQWMGGKKT